MARELRLAMNRGDSVALLFNPQVAGSNPVERASEISHFAGKKQEDWRPQTLDQVVLPTVKGVLGLFEALIASKHQLPVMRMRSSPSIANQKGTTCGLPSARTLASFVVPVPLAHEAQVLLVRHLTVHVYPPY